MWKEFYCLVNAAWSIPVAVGLAATLEMHPAAAFAISMAGSCAGTALYYFGLMEAIKRLFKKLRPLAVKALRPKIKSVSDRKVKRAGRIINWIAHHRSPKIALLVVSVIPVLGCKIGAMTAAKLLYPGMRGYLPIIAGNILESLIFVAISYGLRNILINN